VIVYNSNVLKRKVQMLTRSPIIVLFQSKIIFYFSNYT